MQAATTNNSTFALVSHQTASQDHKTMATKQATTTTNSTFALLRPSDQMLKSLLHAPSGVLASSGLDFLLNMHLRRERTDKTAQQMTRKERTMILDGARKERAMILEEALEVMDALLLT
jgi:hypothetical protein